MSASASISAEQDTGVEVLDLHSDPAFARRQLHVRDASMQMEAINRLARILIQNPGAILQELVNAAVDLCGADSAGISVENRDETGVKFFEWVATAGRYAGFVNARLPPTPSPCGVCLQRGQPQLFRVSKPFFDLLGVDADFVTDGILIPWQVEEQRGTIWVIAHGRSEAFDTSDHRLMQSLANFAALGVSQQRRQALQLEQATATAAAAMANDLAHQINNPLQSLTNIVFLASQGHSGTDAQALAEELSIHLERLSVLAGKLLVLPAHSIRN